MTKTLFSVLIITYNQEKYIAETLNSIINQENPYTYEIVIGDDCSHDSTRSIINEFKDRYPDIIKPIFNEKNLGIIKNYYNVLEHCSGTYIMQCAGDDYWCDGKIKKQISFMIEHPDCGLSYGKARIFNETKRTFQKDVFGTCKITLKEFLEGNSVPAATVCFKNELIRDYLKEINPLEKNWLMEDYPQWLWFSGKSTVSFLDSFLAVYRVFETSGSHFNSFDKRIAFCKSTNEIKLYFSKLFNEPVSISTENEMYMNEYVSFLIKEGKYNHDLSKKFIYYSKIAHPDSFKQKMIRFLVGKKLTCWIYIVIRRHK